MLITSFYEPENRFFDFGDVNVETLKPTRFIVYTCSFVSSAEENG